MREEKIQLLGIDFNLPYLEMNQNSNSNKDICSPNCYRSISANKIIRSYSPFIVTVVSKLAEIYSFDPCKATRFLNNMRKLFDLSCQDTFYIFRDINFSKNPNIISNYIPHNIKPKHRNTIEAQKTLRRYQNSKIMNRAN